MASEVFSLVYDGEAIQNGEMSVAELGPALVAIGELFDAADALFNGNETTVSTKVKAEFKEGSFEVFFHIHQALTNPDAGSLPGVLILGGDPLISHVIGKLVDKAKDGIVDGLFKLLEKLRGNAPERIERGGQRNVNVFVLGNGNSISVNQETTQLYENSRVRELASRVGGPLKKRGITKLRAKRDEKEIVELEQRDFPEPKETPLLGDSATDGNNPPQSLIVQILKPAFVEGKWSVSDGNKRFQVDMEDSAFKGRVHAREVGFYDGDLYRVEMVTAQHMKNGKLSTERKITRVVEPVSKAVQASLELPAPTKAEGRKFKDLGE